MIAWTEPCTVGDTADSITSVFHHNLWRDFNKIVELVEHSDGEWTVEVKDPDHEWTLDIPMGDSSRYLDALLGNANPPTLDLKEPLMHFRGKQMKFDVWEVRDE